MAALDFPEAVGPYMIKHRVMPEQLSDFHPGKSLKTTALRSLAMFRRPSRARISSRKMPYTLLMCEPLYALVQCREKGLIRAQFCLASNYL
jgi:hypothetical protein